MEIGFLPRDVVMLLIGGLITAVVGWYWGHRRREHELTYSVIEDRTLMSWSTDDGGPGSVDGREIWNPRYIAIRIENTGKEEFVADDFEEPVRFAIADTVKVVRIGETSNRSLVPETLPHVTAGIPIGFKPLMLKPGEWFDLEAFAELDIRGSRKISIAGRVHHIDSLKLSDSSLPVDSIPALRYTLPSRTKSRSMGLRPQIPIGYAGLLVIALVAVIGFAAFSGSP